MEEIRDLPDQTQAPSSHLLKEIVAGALWFPALVFLGHALLVWVLGITSDLQGTDIVFHALGGVSIAFASSRTFESLRRRGLVRDPGAVVRAVLTVSVTATAAVAWEFFEFCCDFYLGTSLQLDLPNTMSDMAFGILGGIAYVLASRSTGLRV